MPLGAFLAGLLLSETEYRHQVEADIRPFRGLLLGLFFMTVGLSMDLGVVSERLTEVVLVVLGLLVLKAALIFALCSAFRLPAEDALRVGLLLAQGGEFGFVLFDVRHRAPGAAGCRGSDADRRGGAQHDRNPVPRRAGKLPCRPVETPVARAACTLCAKRRRR